MKFIYLILITIFLLPQAMAATTWENYSIEEKEIAEGIIEVTKTYSSGNTETSYQIKVTVNGEEGFVDAISVDGEFQISPEGQLQLEALSPGGSGGSGGSGGGGC